MSKVLKPALLMFLLLSLITGVLYPLLVTLVSTATMPEQAAGSLITRDGKILGSTLVGQNFSDPKYFWGRLSATGPYAYNGAVSSGSNLGPLNPVLTDNITARINALRLADPENTAPIPVDLVTASGSGLDPHISPAAAAYQAARVARVRGIAQSSVDALVAQYTEDRQLGIFGEPRVNVLQLNLALDALH
ncbi:MAG: potassium-transporting ATPase subunit KdpC [Haliea sp.]|nr:potassium-transporting ATPase subunit KdpC [Haliea sp.]